MGFATSSSGLLHRHWACCVLLAWNVVVGLCPGRREGDGDGVGSRPSAGVATRCGGHVSTKVISSVLLLVGGGERRCDIPHGSPTTWVSPPISTPLCTGQ